MFTLNRPDAAAIAERIAAAAGLDAYGPRHLGMGGTPGQKPALPLGFAHDHARSRVGRGDAAFAAARQAFERWAMFDLGWVRVANPQIRIEAGELVAVEVEALRLWSLNISRIVEVVDSADRFGFLYATTELHVEEGEERFLLLFDQGSGEVWYDLEAVSRPRSWLARAGLPVARRFQHRFARDSQRRMGAEVAASV